MVIQYMCVAEGDGLNDVVTMREKHPNYYVITSKAPLRWI